MRVVFAVLTLGLISQVGYGEESNLNFGVQGSLNFASSNNSALIDNNLRSVGANQTTRNGIMLGINLEAALSPYLYLQPEFMYTQKGFALQFSQSSYDEDYSGSTRSGSVTADFLSTAVLLKVKPIPHSQIRPYLYVGPEFGINVAESSDISYRGRRVRIPIADFDFAVDMGVGVEGNVAERVCLYTDFRYSMGLVNIAEGPVPGAEIKTSTFQAIAGFRVAL